MGTNKKVAKMLKENSVLIFLIISIALLFVAILIYPGGTYQDRNSLDFNWAQNFISDLLNTKALNGSPNISRIWAYFGLLFYSLGGAIFFVRMANKIPNKNASNFIKYAGLSTMPFTLLIIIFHDLMLSLSSIVFWTCMTCITVFVLKTRHHFLKIYCIFCLIIFYYATYLYASENWNLLAIIQKANILSSLILILSLDYFTKSKDFTNLKKSSYENQIES